MKTIALFGGSGQTGKLFLEKALAAGFTVKALVRNPDSLNIKHPNLTIIEGNVLDVQSVNKTIEGTDMVMSLFGQVKDSPEWLQTDGTKNIVLAMKKHKVSRVVSLSGGGLPYPEKDEPKFADIMIRFIMKIAVPKILNDAIAHYKVLADSGLRWTIVRGPRLTNDPSKGEYRVGWVGVNASTKISRGDLSDFLLTQVTDESFVKQMPFVSW
jgi:putative NADH-flavin reductase